MSPALAEGTLRDHFSVVRLSVCPSVCLSVCPSVRPSHFFVTLIQIVITSVLLQLMTSNFIYRKNILQERALHKVDNSTCNKLRVIVLWEIQILVTTFCIRDITLKRHVSNECDARRGNVLYR